MPRAFSYVASWARTRQVLLPELVELVDVGRAWQEVNLEQVIVIQHRATAASSWRALRREGEAFRFVTDIARADHELFDSLPAPASGRELALGRKLAAHPRLGDYTSNQRGVGLQQQIRSGASRQGWRVIGGKHIQPWRIIGEAGHLPHDTSLPARARVQPGSILAQNILTFSDRPTQRIRITATMAPPDDPDLVTLDTVNQLRLKRDCPCSGKFLLALLNSGLIHWYTWRFIHAAARMTIHFDTPASAPLPVPAINFNDPADQARHDALDESAARMLALHAELARSEELCDDRRHELQRRIDELDADIDAQVYTLFNLSEAEIALVEGRADGH